MDAQLMKRLAFALVILVAASGVAWAALTMGSAVNYAGLVGRNATFVSGGSLRSNGILDLVTADAIGVGTGYISVFLGNGDGTFQAHADYSMAPAQTPTCVQLGSTRGNGVLDVVVGLYDQAGVFVMLGGNDGTFAGPVFYSTGVGTTPQCVALGSLRNNGILDIVVTLYGSNKIAVLLGNGDGTFAPHADYTTGANPAILALGSLRGNGVLDAVVANSGTTSVSVLLGNGDGTFASKVDYTTSAAVYAVALGDFNEDGKLDVVASHGTTIGTFQGNGDGTLQAFTTAFTTAGGANLTGISVGDISGSGHLSLICNNYTGTPNNVQISLGNGDGTFGAPTSLNSAAAAGPYYVRLGDFDGDGKLDVAACNYTSNDVSVWLQTTAETRGGFPGTSAILGNLPNPSGGYPRVVEGARRNGSAVSK